VTSIQSLLKGNDRAQLSRTFSMSENGKKNRRGRPTIRFRSTIQGLLSTELEVLTPGMENSQEADARTQMSGIGGDLQHIFSIRFLQALRRDYVAPQRRPCALSAALEYQRHITLDVT
jgi:hypothetical protein